MKIGKSIQKNGITVSLCWEKLKKNYYSNLNEKNITDSKNFWKTVTPFLSDKVLSTKKITLTENDKIIKNDSEIASIMNTFFL